MRVVSCTWLAFVASVVGCGGGDTGSPADAGAQPATDAGGPCTITAAEAICHTQPVVTITNGSDARPVYWAKPVGDAPASGRPAVVLYQGTDVGPSTTWDVDLDTSAPFGAYYQVALIASLIEAGYIVVQPDAEDGIAWDTNDGDYDTSPDAVFIPQLLAKIAQGVFGAIDVTHLYATGISSGGYMTSRMAVSYPGQFRALAIESGSYATCLGAICTIPTPLPSDHPPTLFLHGGEDDIVPISTAQAYYQALMAQGIDTKFIEDPTAGHEWLSTAPQNVTQWFLSH
jgi:dipeptidyl aminopeptidase/acylaminoacyl peptidase